MSDKVDVDLTAAKLNTGLWLVKVPKYLAQQWSKASGKGEVGTLRFCKNINQANTEVSFVLNEELTVLESSDDKMSAVPTEHPVTIQAVGGQMLVVFSETSAGSGEELSHLTHESRAEPGQAEELYCSAGSESTCETVIGAESAAGPDKISIEGTVVHRAECKPAINEHYMRLKRLQIQDLSKPVRLSQQLERPVTSNYKPVANHAYNIEYERRKKEEGKRARAEKQRVLDMLFSAFEKHQFYNIRDLVEITKQPVIYLKDILRDIGIYNVKGTHKNTWELKPEYRHYHSEKTDE
ncbi:general transcription factor IIF subunit 2-like [Neosynchiropus ocellatus]